MAGVSEVAVPVWLRELYRQVDAADLDGYLQQYADDAELRFGSAPPVRGKDAVRDALGRGHAAHEMVHTFRNVWEVADTAICEFDVRYTVRANSAVVDLPSLAILHRRASDGLIDQLRVYIDQQPLRDAEAGPGRT
jgi:ketosteroid isomerase-like protein